MDFLLSSNGDLIFHEIDLKKKRVKIDFFVSRANVLKVNFEMIHGIENNINKNGLRVDFDYKKMAGDKKVMIAKDISLLKQKILIEIKTSLGELKNRQEVGSTLENVLHKTITDNKTINAVRRIVCEIVDKYDNSLNVEVYPYLNTDEKYVQALVVDISKDNNQIFNYELEW